MVLSVLLFAIMLISPFDWHLRHPVASAEGNWGRPALTSVLESISIQFVSTPV